MNDPENPEWTARDFAAARPASEMLPPEVTKQLVRSGDSFHADQPIAAAVLNSGPGLNRDRFGSLTLRRAA